VVLAPLISLKGDLLKRAKSANLNAAIWESSQEKIEKLMFVLFESIYQNPNWEKWIEAHRQEISRIYVDEAHTIISQSKWRYIMRYISELNLLKLLITFLTATLTLETQVLLFKEMELDENTRVIRGLIKRENIHYAVHFLKANETEDVHYKRVIDQYLTSLRNNNTLITGDQMLIFISGSYDDIERMANEFRHEYYHSSQSDREAVLASFKNGEFVILISSSALRLGLDMQNIRCIIQIGFLSSIINFSQESGRAGRDGKKAHSLIITPVNKNRAECAIKRISYELSELNWVLFQQIDKNNMSKFIYTSQYRRLLLNNAFDNLVNQQCDISKGDKLCDLCVNRQRITNKRAQQKNQKQALRLGNTIKLGELLDQLKNTCIWYVFVGN
jgi:superfamily II DNA helicase RecQ